MNLKKTLITNIALIAFGIVTAIGLSYAYAAWSVPAATYSDPSGTAPANNTDTPLNISILDQVKASGTCAAGNCGGLSVETFLATMNAQFSKNVTFNDVIGGGTAPFGSVSQMYFGGTDSAGFAHPTSVAIAGGLDAEGVLKSAKLENTEGMKALCSDAEGKVVFCDIVDVCSNIAGNQTVAPDGYVQDAGGMCTVEPKRYYASIPSQSFNQFFGGQYFAKTEFPLIWTLGIYNGFDHPVYNEIPGVARTQLSPNNTLILGNAEAGTYTFKISSSGQLGIKGKFGSDYNQTGIDFYMKAGNEWISISPDGSPKNYYQGVESSTLATMKTHHRLNPADKSLDFYGHFPDDSKAFGIAGTGDDWQYIPFSFNFNKTLHLNQGESVQVYALIYGTSDDHGTFNDSYNNFSSSLDMSNTIFDIMEIPD
jgi:hypothetical protein